MIMMMIHIHNWQKDDDVGMQINKLQEEKNKRGKCLKTIMIMLDMC